MKNPNVMICWFAISGRQSGEVFSLRDSGRMAAVRYPAIVRTTLTVATTATSTTKARNVGIAATADGRLLDGGTGKLMENILGVGLVEMLPVLRPFDCRTRSSFDSFASFREFPTKRESRFR